MCSHVERNRSWHADDPSHAHFVARAVSKPGVSLPVQTASTFVTNACPSATRFSRKTRRSTPTSHALAPRWKSPAAGGYRGGGLWSGGVSPSGIRRRTRRSVQRRCCQGKGGTRTAARPRHRLRLTGPVTHPCTAYASPSCLPIATRPRITMSNWSRCPPFLLVPHPHLLRSEHARTCATH